MRLRFKFGHQFRFSILRFLTKGQHHCTLVYVHIPWIRKVYTELEECIVVSTPNLFLIRSIFTKFRHCWEFSILVLQTILKTGVLPLTIWTPRRFFCTAVHSLGTMS
jgi:hypothetical protein